MGSLGAPEILVILVVALLVLGPNRLPEAARQAGRAMAELRKLSSGFQAELRDAMQVPEAGPPAPSVTSTPGVTSTDAGATERPTDSKFRWSDLPPAPPT